MSEEKTFQEEKTLQGEKTTQEKESGYKRDLDRVYESQIAGHRCGRCGRVISDDDRYSGKLMLGDVGKFMDIYKVRPIKTTAFICGRCANQVEEERKKWNGDKSYSETYKELFCGYTPQFDRTVRADLEAKDLLPMFSEIQYKIMGVTNEFCVRDIFTTNGYAVLHRVCKRY